MESRVNGDTLNLYPKLLARQVFSQGIAGDSDKTSKDSSLLADPFVIMETGHVNGIDIVIALKICTDPDISESMTKTQMVRLLVHKQYI